MISNKNTRQSYWWYVPICGVITMGYIIGGYLSFGVYYLGAFESLTDPGARFVLILFGMGMLGSSLYCSRWWAEDIEESIKKEEFLPHCFDLFGYATLIVGGGITGVVLYLALKAGVMLAIVPSEPTETRLSFSLVISFCGGLFHFKVRRILSGILQKLTEEKD